MSGKQIAIYVLSFIFAPVTMLVLALGFWIGYPRIVKNRSKKEE